MKPVNPELPPMFDNTPNGERPESHHDWWERPFIVTFTWEQMAPPATSPISPEERERSRASWFDEWPSGTRYDVRCLDGGAWDRSTWWGAFRTLEEAQACEGPAWRRSERV